MNRTAILCALGLALLTLAAFVDHVRTHELPGKEPPADLGVAAAAGAASRPVTMPEPTAPDVDLAALGKRVESHVVQPLREHRLTMASFSRVRMPAPVVELEMEETVHAPKESGPTFVLFRVFESGEEGFRPQLRRQLTVGRIDTATGAIELAPGTAHAPQAEAFEGLAAALARLGVRASAGKGQQGKRPW